MSWLAVRRRSLTLPGWPPAFHRLRILHLSDLHLRSWNRVLSRLRRVLVETRYDLLVMTGDFGVQPQDCPRTGRMLARLLRGVRPAIGAFATLGNHDGYGLIPCLGQLGVRVLSNDHVLLRRGSGVIAVAGVEQFEGQCGDLPTALGHEPPGCPTLLLAHYPSTIHHLPPGAVLVQFSGHTHAGQWRVPGWGCLWANDHLRLRHAWGLNRVNGTVLHVSAGVGVSGPLLCRFNCPAEVTLFTLLSDTPA